jgi:A nuclease family of the HNH/ENDO VII superfamily with conserved AHH
VTVGKIIKAARTSASKKLADAMIKAGIKRPDGTDAHHIVAIGHRLAQESREILAKFGVKLDQAENGAFLPSNLKSPNPNGAIVHATLANKHDYYRRVERALREAKSKQDVIRILGRIRQTLEDGTFYHAHL